MSDCVLAVGIDPAKRVHRAVAVLYPDRVLLDEDVLNHPAAIEQLDAKLDALARRHGATLVYGIEDHRRYGRAVVEVLQARGRTVRVVNPLWTHRQKDFYGQDKDDAVDARAIAAVVLRRAEQLPDATEASALAASIREAERMLEDLARKRVQALNRLHQLLTDTYLPSYEAFFGKLKSPWTLRFFERFPLPQDLRDLSAEQLARILLELAGGRIGPVSRASRLAQLKARAQRIREATEALRHRPRTLPLELKAELIRQLCQELLLLHERVLRLRRLLRDELLPARARSSTPSPAWGRSWRPP